jgi:hypothetical protein
MAHVRFCRRADGRETIRLASGERSVGERRCQDCHVFSRALGLGGQCTECDQPILLAELLELEITP